MITAHAPAGYIGAQLLYRLKPATVSARAWSLYGVASGLLPDIDMLWFYLSSIDPLSFMLTKLI